MLWERENAKGECDTLESIVESFFDDPESRQVPASEFEDFFAAWERHQERISVWLDLNSEWRIISSTIMSLITANPSVSRQI